MTEEQKPSVNILPLEILKLLNPQNFFPIFPILPIHPIANPFFPMQINLNTGFLNLALAQQFIQFNANMVPHLPFQLPGFPQLMFPQLPFPQLPFPFPFSLPLTPQLMLPPINTQDCLQLMADNQKTSSDDICVKESENTFGCKTSEKHPSSLHDARIQVSVKHQADQLKEEYCHSNRSDSSTEVEQYSASDFTIVNGRILCTRCKMVFNSRRMFNQHFHKFHMENAKLCGQVDCEYSTSNMKKMYVHRRNVHGVELPKNTRHMFHECHNCGFAGETRQGLHKHMLTHEKLIAVVKPGMKSPRHGTCGENLKNSPYYSSPCSKIEMQNFIKDGDRIKCLVCRCYYVSFKTWSRHYRTCHRPGFVCGKICCKSSKVPSKRLNIHKHRSNETTIPTVSRASQIGHDKKRNRFSKPLISGPKLTGLEKPFPIAGIVTASEGSELIQLKPSSVFTNCRQMLSFN